MPNLDVPLDELIKQSAKARRTAAAPGRVPSRKAPQRQAATNRPRQGPSKRQVGGISGVQKSTGSPKTGRVDAMSRTLDELIKARRLTRTVGGSTAVTGPRTRIIGRQQRAAALSSQGSRARGNTSLTTVGSARLRRPRGAPLGAARATAALLNATTKLNRYFNKFTSGISSVRRAGLTTTLRGLKGAGGDSGRRVSSLSRVQKSKRDISEQLRRYTAASTRRATGRNTPPSPGRKQSQSPLNRQQYGFGRRNLQQPVYEYETGARRGTNLAKDRPRAISRNNSVAGTVMRSSRGSNRPLPTATEPPTIHSTVSPSASRPVAVSQGASFTNPIPSFTEQERNLLSKIKIMANLVETSVPPQNYAVSGAQTAIAAGSAPRGARATVTPAQPAHRAYVTVGTTAQPPASRSLARIGDRY